jgi:hypothetical protein
MGSKGLIKIAVCIYRYFIHFSEIKLQDLECPQGVASDYAAVGMECRFAYKRNDAAFAWPTMSANLSPGPRSNAGYTYDKHSTGVSHIRAGME